MSKLKPGKSPGRDNIHPEFVIHQHPPTTTSRWLCAFFTACYQRLKLPKIWRCASVIALPKPNKDLEDPKSYRPISLLSVPFKILERMIHSRIEPVVDSQLPREQAGFCHGRSTADQVTLFSQDIENSFHDNEKAGVVYLDLTAAYDTVWHRGLHLKLLRTIPDRHMVKFIMETLSNRSFILQTSSRQCSRLRRLRNGVPQGSVLSPMLFNIYIHDLPDTSSTKYGYADDLAIMLSQPTWKGMEDGLNEDMDTMVAYLRRWRLQLSVGKTVAAAYHLGTREAKRELKVSVDGKLLEVQQAPKYLGVRLDRTLSFSQHLQELKAKRSSTPMTGLDDSETTITPLLLLLMVAHSFALPLPIETDKWLLAERYLRQFYDLPAGLLGTRKSSDPMQTKIKEMQTFFKLKVTGNLDANTLELMKLARCGVPDVAEYNHFSGKPKWNNNNITFRIENYTPDLKKADVDRAIHNALNIWAAVTPLTFKKLYKGDADIMISFGSKDHGDYYPFDGPRGILAHAFQPGKGIGGDVHFDEDEHWSKDSTEYNLFLVATHEFGHALGLMHSTDRGALMSPNYSYRRGYPLSEDDIDNIQYLYGPNPNHRKVKPKPDAPNKCDPMLSFDAVTELRGETVIFKDRFHWRLHPQMLEPEQTLIKSTWPSIPNKVDAAYENPEKDRIFLFSGIRMWALNGYDVVEGYPKYIHKLGLPKTIREVDAAVYIRDTGKTLLFTSLHLHYWSYDDNTGTMDCGYPRSIEEDFPGIGKKVDAAAYHNGYLYFFHEHTQFEYSYNSRRVTRILRSNSMLNC
ncbi:collagenase 3-like [Diretmus argenteus]